MVVKSWHLQMPVNDESIKGECAASHAKGPLSQLQLPCFL